MVINLSALGLVGGAFTIGIILAVYALIGTHTTEQKNKFLMYGVGILVVAGLFGGLGAFTNAFGLQSVFGNVQAIGGTPAVNYADANCPDTGRTAVTLDVANMLAGTATGIDVVTVATSRETGHVVTIADTTSPTASNLICGNTYDLKGISTTAVAGRFRSIALPSPEGVTIADGIVTIHPVGSDYSVRVNGASASGVLARFYNNNVGAFMWGAGVTAGTFEAGADTVESTVNATATTLSTDEGLDLRMDLKATTSATDVNDFGVLVCINRAVAQFDHSIVTLNGMALTDIKGQLDVNEVKGLASYQDCYEIPQGTAISTAPLSLRVTLPPIAGVNPSTDPAIIIVPIGSYAKTLNTALVGVGAYKDDAGATVTIASDVYTIDIA
jgi:hypothetical protein